MAERTGCRLAEGDEVLTLGNEAQKHLIAAVNDSTATAIAPYLVDDMEIRRHDETCVLDAAASLGPRVDCELPHVALSVGAGGCLPIRRSETATPSESRMRATIAELAEPHFRFIVPLDLSTAQQWHTGERLEIGYRTTWRETLDRYLTRGRAWFAAWE